MRWTDQTVLVTGAGGFIGSHLAKALREVGADVHGLLKPSWDRKADRVGFLSGVARHQADVADHHTVHRIVADIQPHWIFHLAAQAIVGGADDAPLATLEANVRGTYNAMHCARASRRLRGIVLASSDKAYGSSPVLPYTESTPVEGGAIYDSSKAAAELVARAVAKRFDLPLAVTRCANIYGPADFHFSRIVPDTCRSLARGEAPRIRGDGRHRRDFLHIEDAVRAYLALVGYLAGQPDARGEPFNFGHGIPVAMIDVVTALIAASDQPDLEPIILAHPTPTEIRDQYVDCAKARAVLNWAPEVQLATGLRRTLDWYQGYFANHRP